MHQPEGEEPVRDRPDDGIEQPGPVEAGEKGRHGPGQEHQRLGDRPALKGLVEQQRQDQPENELQDDGGAGPPERIPQRAIEGGIAGKLAEMIEPDEAAGKRIEQLDIAEGIGNADRQRHQYHRNDQDQRRRAVEIGLRSIGNPTQP